MFDNRLTSTVQVFNGERRGPLFFVRELNVRATRQEREDALWLAFDDAAARLPGQSVRAVIVENGHPVSEIQSVEG